MCWRRQNSMKSSRADSCVKVSNLAAFQTLTVPIFRVHPEDGNKVSLYTLTHLYALEYFIGHFNIILSGMTINPTVIPALITIRPTCFGTVDRLNRVNRLSSQHRTRDFSPLRSISTRSGAHPSPIH